MSSESPRIKTFEEFWPYYLSEHSKPMTRRLHLAGTLTGTVLLVLAILSSNYWLILAGLLSGYAFAWLSHLFVERNRPATFKYPLWSIVADYKMAVMTLTGRKF